MKERKEERLQAVSIMRVMAMLMIVTYHSMLFYTGTWGAISGPDIPLWNTTSSVLDAIDLPMFVFISGILFGYLYIDKKKYRNKFTFIKNKFLRLIIPYLFWGLFLILVMPSIHNMENLLTGISHLWFLLMLFNVFLIIIFVAEFLCIKASKWNLLAFYVITCVLFSLFHTYSPHRFFLCAYATLYYLPAFVLGICCSRYRFQDKLSTQQAIIILLSAIAVLVAYIVSGIIAPSIVDYFIKMLAGYTIVVCMFVIFSHNSVKNLFFSKTIAHIDRLSMGIYIFNQIVINAFIMMPEVRLLLEQHYYIGVPVLFTVGLAVPWLLALLFNRSKYLKWTIG